jgi:photosystem II stability/assembly factor-like uncharacterized protein
LWSTNSITVAVGYDGKLATSVNGINWTQRSSSFGVSSIFAVTANQNGKFLITGESGKFADSVDGINWIQTFPTSSFGLSTVRSVSISNDGAYIAAGNNGKLATSFDGVSWIQRVSSFANTDNIYGVFLDNDTALAVGTSGKIAYSV